jgi:hypothetical protein
MSEVAQVRLPDGQVIWARVEGHDGPRDIGFGERARSLIVEGLAETVAAVADNVRSAVDRHHADEVSIEFGLELSARSGKVLSVLAEAAAKSTIAVQLTWRNPPEDRPPGSVPDAASG